MLKALVSTSILVAVLLGGSMPAGAMTFDRTTRFTFNQPVTLPGVTLPAGRYIFRLADPGIGSRVVQVMNDRGTQSYALLLSLPTSRADAALTPELTFMETGTGMPPAVKTWWTEGTHNGYEFIYSRAQLARLAEGVPPEPRPLSVANSEAGFSSDEGAFTTVDERSSDVIAENRADAFDEQAAQQPAPSPVTEAAPAVEQQSQDVRDELPRTAGPLPFVMVLGLASLFGGLWLTRK